MSKWTLREQRTRQIRQGYRQEHTAAQRATRYVRRHAWQFHGAGVEDAVEALSGIDGDFSVSEALAKLAVSLNATCLCTHPYSTHNVNGLCIALPGVLGCGCLGWSEVRPTVVPAQCDECGHAHVSGVECAEDTFGSFMCRCTG